MRPPSPRRIRRPSFGKDERHRVRVRHLYGVFFKGTDVYVGQSVDLRRREREHRKAWPRSFRFVKLGSIRGTYADAEIAEQAWRCLATRQGHTILAIQGDMSVRVNPHIRRTREVNAFMRQLRWPKHLRAHRRWRRWLVGGAVITLAGTGPHWIPVFLKQAQDHVLVLSRFFHFL